MRALVCSLASIVLLAASPALAGRNANGALVVHADDSINYTPCEGAYFYCAQPIPTSCESLDTQFVWQYEPVLFILAAFDASSSPSVSAIRFGLQYNFDGGAGFGSAHCWGACGSALEQPDADWPAGGADLRSGNLVTFPSPVFERVFKVYHFSIDQWDTEQPNWFIASVPYSESEPALFYDDSVPPNEDVCTGFGIARWTQPGHNDCPQVPSASVREASARIAAVGSNPFTGRTTLGFTLSVAGAARVEILDLQGGLVVELARGEYAAGTHEVTWDATGSASGVYFARLTTDAGTRSVKLIHLD